jgi:uncharacterized protein YcaQ
MILHLSREQARRLLAHYHFTPTDIPGVFERLGTVQYDPLNPVGRNADLVLQARVPGYRVDDWHKPVYADRIAYDAWDKQACIVPISDWPMRALIREKYRPYHDREILQNDSEGMESVLRAIDERGPLSSLEFEDKTHAGLPGSWAGATRIKRILRSLWACGLLVTHHRKAGRHYYDRPERVIPAHHFSAPPLTDEDAYYRWILLKRYQATGLLRSTAESAIWCTCDQAPKRKKALGELVESGQLLPVKIEDLSGPYYLHANALKLLDQPLPQPRMIFVGPLDSLLWDRKALQQIFHFDYMWEVYKPAPQRKWGYYVLPVFYGDRFVARFDSRLEKGVWNILRWWWEPDITPNVELVEALRTAAQNFLCYMGASSVQLDESIDRNVRAALSLEAAQATPLASTPLPPPHDV